jgi:DNA-binding IclR family transcriptional regulator
MTKQSVIRALKTLSAQGYLVKDAAGKSYELGYRMLELCNFDPAEPELTQICAPYMQQLHVLTQASILLAVPVGYHAIIIDGIDGNEQGFQLRRHKRGFPIPLNLGPAARAILAFLPDEEIRRFMEQGSPFSDPSARYVADPDAEALWAHIRLIRQRGYDIGGGELIANALGLAFPILDGSGYPLGSINLSSSEDRLSRDKILTFVPVMMQVMNELNKHTRMLHAM